jgi:hypothetical protein
MRVREGSLPRNMARRKLLEECSEEQTPCESLLTHKVESQLMGLNKSLNQVKKSLTQMK